MNWPETDEGGRLGDGRFASATDRPGSIDELREVARRRADEGQALYPRGGATALDFGGVPRLPGVAVDLRGLNRVVDYPVADMTVTVEAGITLASLREIVAAQGQRLAIDAPEADRATLGGIFATDASGPRRFGLGRPRDQIIGVRFVNAEGEAIKGGGRVVKNVAGYDLPKLLTGSMGTLGIIAELTLKVRPAPEATAIAWVRVRTLNDATRALEGLNTSGTRPIALELLDRKAAAEVGPDHPADDWVLVIGLEGNAEAVAWEVDRLGTELGRGDLVVLEGAASLPLWSSLIDWPATAPGLLSFTANLRTSAALDFLARVDPGRWAIQAHAGSGIVRGIYRGDPESETVATEVDRLRAEARRRGGSLILPRCPTEWKGRLKVWGDPRVDWALAARVKQALDPRGLLNPGRFVGTI